MMKRVAANDPTSIFMLGNYYLDGIGGLHQDAEKAKEHWTQAAKFGSNKAHYHLGRFYEEGGDITKAKFHYEAPAMTGHDSARYNLGVMEGHSGNIERALKHLRIAASAGYYKRCIACENRLKVVLSVGNQLKQL